MTSGVYQLTFPNGDTYIGKSINVEERWKQHCNKMTKGTAAKNMQAAWNSHRNFNADILVECHEDHIDVVEASLIVRHRPTLNSDRPKDPFPDMDVDSLCELFVTFKHSARELVAQKESISRAGTIAQTNLNNSIKELKSENHSLHQEIKELVELNNDLLKVRSDEELKADISKRIDTLEVKLAHYILHKRELEKECNNLSKEATRLFIQLEYFKLPWWNRLFRNPPV